MARALLLLGVFSKLALLSGETGVGTCSTGRRAVAVAAGFDHSCALLVRRHHRPSDRHRNPHFGACRLYRTDFEMFETWKRLDSLQFVYQIICASQCAGRCDRQVLGA